MEDKDQFMPLIEKPEEHTSWAPSLSYGQLTVMKLKENRLALFSILILCVLVSAALLGPLLSPYTYYETHLPLKNLPPNASFWFGTDELGRDLFTRCCWGLRISLLIGTSASFLDLIVGVLFGSVAALCGGKIEEWMMRCADVLYSIPYLLVVILLMVIMGPGLATLILALALTGWINMARIVRGQVLQIKYQDFVMAAVGLGASKGRIIGKHLIPNAMGPILVTLTFTIPAAIFAEAFLSFLGLGVQAPIASLGTMANDGLAALRYYPWRLFFPALFLSLIMLSFNVIGDGLRDALDPRLNV